LLSHGYKNHRDGHGGGDQMIFGSGLDRKEIFCSRFDCWKRGHIICELAGITTMVQQICDVSIKVVFE
jgi:hypothetical protein